MFMYILMCIMSITIGHYLVFILSSLHRHNDKDLFSSLAPFYYIIKALLVFIQTVNSLHYTKNPFSCPVSN